MPLMTTNLICQARTRKPETFDAMPDVPLALLQSSCPVHCGSSHSLDSLQLSRATLAAFISSHIQPQFPESAVASFYLFDAGLSSLTARPRPARVLMAPLDRRWVAATFMQVEEAPVTLISAYIAPLLNAGSVL